MTRTPHEDLLLDIALDRLAILLAARGCNPESVPREEIITAVMQCAIVIEQSAPAQLPRYDMPVQPDPNPIDVEPPL